jgi:hypothetical protein
MSDVPEFWGVFLLRNLPPITEDDEYHFYTSGTGMDVNRVVPQKDHEIFAA